MASVEPQPNNPKLNLSSASKRAEHRFVSMKETYEYYSIIWLICGVLIVILSTALVIVFLSKPAMHDDVASTIYIYISRFVVIAIMSTFGYYCLMNYRKMFHLVVSTDHKILVADILEVSVDQTSGDPTEYFETLLRVLVAPVESGFLDGATQPCRSEGRPCSRETEDPARTIVSATGAAARAVHHAPGSAGAAL